MQEKYNILVVDDEKDIREVIEIYLINAGFNVLLAEDGIEALETLNNEKIDLIILDIMMPRLDGIRACMKIRETQQIPIIMLSAKTEASDRILGLNIGADDYITKPFNPLELVARVSSQIRRTKVFTETKNEDEYVVGALTLNPKTREVFVEGEFARLTPREFDILEILMANKGMVLSTTQIYEKVWKEDFCNSDNTVAVHIRNIREKIEINPKEPKYIKLVWGVGYKFEK